MRLLTSDVLRVIVLSLLIIALGLLVGLYKKPPQNLIVISLDSVRADHLAVYGYTRETMPNLDAWASRSAFVFMNYFATSYLTPISEVSVQTGEYPVTTGVVNFAAVARPTVPFLAEILKNNGYRTAAFGSSPEYLINDGLRNSFSRGFDIFVPYATTTSRNVPGQKIVTGRTSSASVSGALSWLTSARASGKPFYLWLPLGSAHMPYFEAKPIHFADPAYTGFLSKISYDEFNTLYGFLYNGFRYDKSVTKNSPVVGRLDPADTQFITDRYDDGLYLSDQILAPLFDYLKTSGLENNTVIVFESEHGETLGERGYFEHYDIHDETLKTPLMIQVPGLSGGHVSALTSGIDVAPTVLNLLHVPATKMAGMSYVPALTGKAKELRTDVFAIRTPLWERVSGLAPDFTKADDTAHYYDTAIRSMKWKLIHRISREAQVTYGWWGILSGNPVTQPEYELYDLTHDPGETKNVYDREGGDIDVVALKTKLSAYETSITKYMPGETHAQVQPYF